MKTRIFSWLRDILLRKDHYFSGGGGGGEKYWGKKLSAGFEKTK